MSDATSRLGLPYPELTDEADIEEAVKPLAELLDVIATIGSLGLASARPAAGIPNRIYYTTDTRMLFLDTGSEWRQIDPRGAAGGELAGSYPNPSIAPGAITLAHLAAALKPSTGAGTSAEALRALGTAAGTAAAGSHAAQHAGGGADPITVSSPNMGATYGDYGSGGGTIGNGQTVVVATRTIPANRGGVFQLNMNMVMDSTGHGFRGCFIRVGGQAVAAANSPWSGFEGLPTNCSCGCSVTLAGGAVVEWAVVLLEASAAADFTWSADLFRAFGSRSFSS